MKRRRLLVPSSFVNSFSLLCNTTYLSVLSHGDDVYSLTDCILCTSFSRYGTPPLCLLSIHHLDSLLFCLPAYSLIDTYLYRGRTYRYLHLSVSLRSSFRCDETHMSVLIPCLSVYVSIFLLVLLYSRHIIIRALGPHLSFKVVRLPHLIIFIISIILLQTYLY